MSELRALVEAEAGQALTDEQYSDLHYRLEREIEVFFASLRDDLSDLGLLKQADDDEEDQPMAPQQPEQPANDYWPLTRLAAALGISASALRQRVSKGSVQATKVGRDWIIPASEAQRLLSDQAQQQPTEQQP